MKYLFLTLLVMLLPLVGNSQPVPPCIGADRRIIVKTYQELFTSDFYAGGFPVIDSAKVKCASVEAATIKDTLGIYFFDFKLYKCVEDSYEHYRTKSIPKDGCMHIYIGGLNWDDSLKYSFPFSYYLEIPEFYNGDIWIDVSKISKDNSVLLPCRECWWECKCIDCLQKYEEQCDKNISILNITPAKYEEPPLAIKKRKEKKTKIN